MRLTTVNFITEQTEMKYFYLVAILCVLSCKVESKILSLSETVTDINLLCLDSYFHKIYKELISFRFLSFKSHKKQIVSSEDTREKNIKIHVIRSICSKTSTELINGLHTFWYLHLSS